MDDAAGMGVGERPCHFLDDTYGFALAARPAAADALSERFAVDMGHDKEDDVVVRLDRMNRDDVRVRERRRHAGLLEESLAEVPLSGQGGR